MGIFTNKYSKYTDEQLRNLKVDVKKIPEWEEELKSLMADFEEISPIKIQSAINVLLEAEDVVRFGIEYEDLKKARKWMEKIDSHKLLWLTNDYAAPVFLRHGFSFNFTDWLNNKIKDQQMYISSLEKSGTSDSFLVRLATNKVVPQRLSDAKSLLADYKSFAPKSTVVSNAILLVNRIKELSDSNSKKAAKIEERLRLAKLKMGALEKFERKHGKAFAKAAAAEQQTRQRASSIKRMVKRTENCPYCSEKLTDNAHLDHIYPVSKGGLSIVENLVWCCATCNSIKSDKGLVQFLNERGCSISLTLDRLQALEKHV